jgi:hypothetical protein
MIGNKPTLIWKSCQDILFVIFYSETPIPKAMRNGIG